MKKASREPESTVVSADRQSPASASPEFVRIVLYECDQGCYRGFRKVPMPPRSRRPGRPKRSRATALARRDPHADLTESELAQLVDSLIDATNGHVRKSDLEREEAANELFRRGLGNDPALVLAAPPATRVYRALRQRTGKGLDLTADELDDFLGIGALNQHLPDARWRNLLWSRKLALLPLTRVRDKMKSFFRGLAYAMLPGTGTEALRRWVSRELPAPDPRGRPQGLSYRGRRQLVSGGERLADPAARARFASEFRKAPRQSRSEFLKELRSTHRNLGLLLTELAKGGGE